MDTITEAANADFWNELCGSGLAKQLGLKDCSLQSLEIFDRWYLNIYPYLLQYVILNEMAGKNVLEIGLGYGTLGQKIAESGACYTGLDIAEGPVRMMNSRLESNHLKGKAIKGSILGSLLPAEHFDYIVSIGCFHHTGDVAGCIEEAYRLLKPRGRAIIMVYNKFSYRQWLKWPAFTFLGLLQEYGFCKQKVLITEAQRKAYDVDTKGRAAPETVFLSQKQLSGLFSRFSKVKFYKENCDNFSLRGRVIIPREKLLCVVGKACGLDIYIEAQR